MLKNDAWIRFMSELHGMIKPFEPEQIKWLPSLAPEYIKRPVISYGVSSYGYDMRVGRDFKVFTNVRSEIIDPKNISTESFVELKDVDSVLVPPNSHTLARSLERFKIPRDVLCLCLGKSTYARCGIAINITPLEPEWEGYLTIEIANCTSLPVKVYAEEGIGQLIFLGTDAPCEVSYKDRKGKYQGQTGVTLPIV